MKDLFEQEYKKCEKSLFLIALGYVHNTEDAKDVLQDAAVAAYRAFAGLKHREYFKTWMTRIVINKSKNFLRSKQQTEELTDHLQLFSEFSEEDMGIVDAICRMDTKLSVYITLRFYHGMTYKEVAKVLKQSESTTKYKTKKALEVLKLLLEGEDQT